MANFTELDRVVAHCAANPERHDQSLWLDVCATAWLNPDEGELAEDWQCRTTACVAGWTAILNGWRPIADNSAEMTDGHHVEHATIVAQRVLDLSPRQASMLFTLTCDLADVRIVVERIRAEETARIRSLAEKETS